MVYMDGDVEEGMWRDGLIDSLTRYQPAKKEALVRTSYSWKWGTLVQVDKFNNVVVHPVDTGEPTTRLLISPKGHRYKGEINEYLRM